MERPWNSQACYEVVKGELSGIRGDLEPCPPSKEVRNPRKLDLNLQLKIQTSLNMRYSTLASATLVLTIMTSVLGAAVPYNSTLFDRDFPQPTKPYGEPDEWITVYDFSHKPLGEALNVIVSAYSDPEVKSDPSDWLASLGFFPSRCGSLIEVPSHTILGLGRNVPAEVYRESTDVRGRSTCAESDDGGVRLSVSRQHVARENNAVFIAAIMEKKREGGIQDPTGNGFAEGRANFASRTLVKGGSVSPYTGFRYSMTGFEEFNPPYDTAGLQPLDHPYDGIAILITVRRAYS